MNDISSSHAMLYGLNNYLPPKLRSDILNDESFLEKHSVLTYRVLRLGSDEFTFRDTSLFESLEKALAKKDTECNVEDHFGKVWKVRVIDFHKGLATLSKNKAEIHVGFAWLFFPVSNKKSKIYRNFTKKYGLPSRIQKRFYNIIKNRPLDRKEVRQFLEELAICPEFLKEQLSQEMVDGEGQIPTIAPSNPEYYNRLIGKFIVCENLQELSEKVTTPHINSLVKWNKAEGLKFALLLSSHPLLIKDISLKSYKETELITLYKWLSEYGSLYMKLGAIELALANYEEVKYLEEQVIKMAKAIFDASPDDENGKFTLLSSLMPVVYTTISRNKLFKDFPPHWRRVAAIAQASLIECCCNENLPNLDSSRFSKELFSRFDQDFILRSYSELRVEPKWMPEFFSPEQLQQEFFGRLIGCCGSNFKEIDGTEIFEILMGQKSPLDQAKKTIPPYIPGPIEGWTKNMATLPENIHKELESSLTSDNLNFKKLAPILNSARLFYIPENLVTLLCEKVAAPGNYIEFGKDENSPIYLVEGMAQIAAIYRKPELAIWTLSILRRYLKNRPGEVMNDKPLLAGVLLAASHSDKHKWCRFLGEWLEELSNSIENRECGIRVCSHIETLCSITPELWNSLGHVQASLLSYVQSTNN